MLIQPDARLLQLAYMDYLLRHNLEENHRWGYIGIGMLPQDKAMRDALREQVRFAG